MSVTKVTPHGLKFNDDANQEAKKLLRAAVNAIKEAEPVMNNSAVELAGLLKRKLMWELTNLPTPGKLFQE